MTLFFRKSGDDFVADPTSFFSYRTAVVAGQQRYGRGNFFVDTGNHVPSRSEQLLEDDPSEVRARRRAELLASL